MSNMDYVPMVQNTGQAQPMPWYEVWMLVVTHPSRDSFRRILADPTARPARAFIWVAVIGLIFGVLEAIVTRVVGSEAIGQFGGLGLLANLVCIAIGAPIFSVIGLALGAAILRGIAALLKGVGNFNEMVYSLASVQAPFSIISGILSLIATAVSRGTFSLTGGGGGSLLGLCLAPISLVVGIYAIVLEVLAIDTVEKFGTGKAVLTLLIPLVVLVLIGVCVALVIGIAFATQLQQ